MDTRPTQLVPPASGLIIQSSARAHLPDLSAIAVNQAPPPPPPPAPSLRQRLLLVGAGTQ